MKSFQKNKSKTIRGVSHMDARSSEVAQSFIPPVQRLQANTEFSKHNTAQGAPVQAWFGKKKNKGNVASPSINSMEQLGGTASDVYRAKLSSGIGEYNSDTAYVKKGLRSVTDTDLTNDEKSAFERIRSVDPSQGAYGAKPADLEIAAKAFKRLQSSGTNVIGGATTANLNIKGLSMADVMGALGKSPQEQMDLGVNPLQSPEILTQDPHLIARSVASSRLDQALGTNVLSHEMFGKYQGQTVGLSSEVTGGKAMSNKKKLDEGSTSEKEVSVLSDVNFKDANIQKGMSNLTLMDALTGQQDRHGGNIMVDPGGNVKGIDNDMAFSDKYFDRAKGIRSNLFTKNTNKKGKVTSYNYHQEVIDEQTGNAIIKMSESKFKKILAGSKDDPQKLTKAEISEAVMRFRAVKKQVKLLKKRKALKKNWDKISYNQMMNEGKDVGEGMLENPDALNYLARSVNDYNSANDAVGPNTSHIKEPGFNQHLLEKKKHEESQTRVMGRRMRHFEADFQQGVPDKQRPKPYKLNNVMARRMAHFQKEYKKEHN